MLQLSNLDRKERLKIANIKKKQFMSGISESDMPNMNNSSSQIRGDQSICQSIQEASQYSPSMKTTSPSFTKERILSTGKSSQRISDLDRNERLKIVSERKKLYSAQVCGKSNSISMNNSRSRTINTQFYQDIQINEVRQSALNTTPTKLHCQTFTDQGILSPENFSQRLSNLDREKRLQIASLKKRLFIGVSESNLLNSNNIQSFTCHSQNTSREPYDSIVTKQDDLSQNCSQRLATLDKEARLKIASEKKKRFNQSKSDLLNMNNSQSRTTEAISTSNILNTIPANTQRQTVIKRPHSSMIEPDILLSEKCCKRIKRASEDKSSSVDVTESHLQDMNTSENRTLDSQSTGHSTVNDMPQYSQNTPPKELHLPMESEQHILTPGKFCKRLSNLNRDERLRIAAEKKKRFIEKWISQSSVSAGKCVNRSDFLEEEKNNIASENKTRRNLLESDFHNVNISQSRLVEYRSTENNIKENELLLYSENNSPSKQNFTSETKHDFVSPRKCYESAKIASEKNSSKLDAIQSDSLNINNSEPRVTEVTDRSLNVNGMPQYTQNTPPPTQCLPFVSNQNNLSLVTYFQSQSALNQETRLKIAAEKEINFLDSLEKQRVIELQNIIPGLSWAVPRKSSTMCLPTFPPKWHSVASYPYP